MTGASLDRLTHHRHIFEMNKETCAQDDLRVQGSGSGCLDGKDC